MGEGEGGGDPTELSLGPAAPAAGGEDDDDGSSGDGSAVSLSPTAEQGSPAAAEDSKAVGRSAAVCSLRPPIARPSLAVFTPFFPLFFWLPGKTVKKSEKLPGNRKKNWERMAGKQLAQRSVAAAGSEARAGCAIGGRCRGAAYDGRDKRPRARKPHDHCRDWAAFLRIQLIFSLAN